MYPHSGYKNFQKPKFYKSCHLKCKKVKIALSYKKSTSKGGSFRAWVKKHKFLRYSGICQKNRPQFQTESLKVDFFRLKPRKKAVVSRQFSKKCTQTAKNLKKHPSLHPYFASKAKPKNPRKNREQRVFGVFGKRKFSEKFRKNPKTQK